MLDGASNRPSPGDWSRNICFHCEQFAALPLAATLRRNAESEQSEVALLWNGLRSLTAEDESPAGPVLHLEYLFAAGDVPSRVPLTGAALACWNWPVVGEAAFAPVLRALGGAIRSTESNARRHTEVDAILYRPADRLLVFVEAKLTAPFGACQAVHGDPGGCRMYRTLLDPRQNGCSYWGIGAGGAAFTARFPRRLVEQHLAFEYPNRERPAGADCDRHYQLMRNWLLGQEAVRRMGSGHRFCLAVIGDDRHLDRPACERFARAIISPAGSFAVTTWQALRDGLPAGHPVRDYLERHTIVSHAHQAKAAGAGR